MWILDFGLGSLMRGLNLIPRPRSRRWVEGYLFAAPWILGFVVLTAGSMGFALWVSFNRWNLVQPAEVVGLAISAGPAEVSLHLTHRPYTDLG